MTERTVSQPATSNVLCTIYDERRLKHYQRHVFLFLLHVCSWAENLRGKYPLRVICVGEPNAWAQRLMETHHVEVVESAPHALFDQGKCYNKHLATPEKSTERIFLTDNDTVYLGGMDGLFDGPSSQFKASLAGRARISPELWKSLIKDLGGDPISYKWRPSAEMAEASLDSSRVVEQVYAYVQGGALVFPAGPSFWQTWEKWSYRLVDLLVERGLDGQKSVGTDQASLSLAAGELQNWSRLEPRFNVCWFNYLDEGIDVPGIQHIHFAGIGRVYGRMSSADRTSGKKLIERFWEEKIFSPMRNNDRSEEHQVAAVSQRDEIIRIIDKYELDDLERFNIPGAFPKVG